MKKCPTCEKTFDDNMRFCQSDGTPLIDDTPLDPFKTMVAKPEDVPELAADREMPPPVESEPEVDPRKTIVASEEEIRREMDSFDAQPAREPEPPRLSDPPPPAEEPRFDAPEPLRPTPPTPFGDTPAESRDEFRGSGELVGDPFAKTTPPIPSPFQPRDAGNPGSPMASYTPPPVPASPVSIDPAAPALGADAPDNMNTPASQNQTLSIISLIAGILGVTVCCGSVLPSLVAIVLGFMARGKASSDPLHYGGGTFATVGIILGFVGVVLGLLAMVLYFSGALVNVVNF